MAHNQRRTGDEAPGRTLKYRMLRVLLWGGNHVLRQALRRGVAPRAFALLETTGRRSGQLRHTPIGNGLDGERFWLIAAHGQQADYVRNLTVQPRVRVKIGRAWRSGTAVLRPGRATPASSNSNPGEPTTRKARTCQSMKP